MGCAQGRPSQNSPFERLDKFKMANGYVKGGFAEARRSTGQRIINIDAGRFFRNEGASSGSSEKTSSVNGRSQEKGMIAREVERGSSRGGGNNGKSWTSSSGSRGRQENKAVTKQEQDEGSKGNGIQRVTSKKVRDEDLLVDGWPKWLTDNIPSDALAGLNPRSAETYEKIDKVGQGTYSNVYKARDKYTGKVVAMKKVRFDTSEPESVKFMAREIRILRRLDHPNIVKLEGLATSRMHYSIYLVFDYMQSDLASIINRPDERLTEPQVKCYMHQLLSGLQHCHERGILHRDIKGSNLLIDKKGMLKIADFGLANYFNPEKKRPLTSRVVTLWYRAPELLLGATEYGIGIDLWSAGCLMAEMFAGRPIMPGRTEVEQLHKIFKLCGTPSEDFWKKVKLPTTFKSPQTYRPRLKEAFKNFPASSFRLLSILLALEPARRGSTGSALRNEFFYTSPLACDLSGLPVINKQEEDEPAMTTEIRRHRSAKIRQRSQSRREHRQKDLAEEKPEGDPGGSVEQEKSAETMILSQGPGSSATSTLSSATQKGEKMSPPPFASPDVPNRHNFSRREAYTQTTKNTKHRPPLPEGRRSNQDNNNGKDYIYQMNEIKRSASTREFRNMYRTKLLELHAVD